MLLSSPVVTLFLLIYTVFACSGAQISTLLTDAVGPLRAPRRADNHAAKDKPSPRPRPGGRRRAAADNRRSGRATTTTAPVADPERGRRGRRGRAV
jgi:hypothetical protein